MVDTTKAFEVDNGIVLDSKSGVGIYSDAGSPVGLSAPQGSYYFNSTDGWMWFKYGAGNNDWREVRPEQQQDHTTLFTSNSTGHTFNKNTYERISLGHINGTNMAAPNSQNYFQFIASQSGTSSVDVRLYDLTNAAVLAGPQNITETIPTYFELSYTPAAGEAVVEVQGKKNGNSVGELFWAGIEMLRDSL